MTFDPNKLREEDMRGETEEMLSGFWFYSPLVVSLSRIIKEPTLFPEASSCLSASFLLTPLKNQLKNRKQTGQNFTGSQPVPPPGM